VGGGNGRKVLPIRPKVGEKVMWWRRKARRGGSLFVGGDQSPITDFSSHTGWGQSTVPTFVEWKKGKKKKKKGFKLLL